MAVELGVEVRDGGLSDRRVGLGDGKGEELLENLVDELDGVVARLCDDGVVSEDLTAREGGRSSNVGVVVLDVADDMVANEFAEAVVDGFD